MGDINWFGGSGQTNPTSPTFKSDKVGVQKTNKKPEANLWAGEVPKEIPTNPDREIGAFDQAAGSISEARHAVNAGLKIALTEIPKDLKVCRFVEDRTGIYEVFDDNRLIGYTSENLNDN